MTDSPTMRLPLPAFTIKSDEWRAQRRKGEVYRLRCDDLKLAEEPGALPRGEALKLAARMSAWPDKWPEEHTALRQLMRRHGLTASQIVDEQRRALIVRKP